MGHQPAGRVLGKAAQISKRTRADGPPLGDELESFFLVALDPLQKV